MNELLNKLNGGFAIANVSNICLSHYF